MYNVLHTIILRLDCAEDPAPGRSPLCVRGQQHDELVVELGITPSEYLRQAQDMEDAAANSDETLGLDEFDALILASQSSQQSTLPATGDPFYSPSSSEAAASTSRDNLAREGGDYGFSGEYSVTESKDDSPLRANTVATTGSSLERSIADTTKAPMSKEEKARARREATANRKRQREEAVSTRGLF